MYDIINYCTIIIFMVFNFAYIPSQLNNLIVLAYRHVYIIAHFLQVVYIISHTKLVYSLAYLLDQLIVKQYVYKTPRTALCVHFRTKRLIARIPIYAPNTSADD